jgi:hypothetical protein
MTCVAKWGCGFPCYVTCAMPSNRSFDTDTHRQGAARRADNPTPRGALPVRAGQLRRYAAREALR